MVCNFMCWLGEHITTTADRIKKYVVFSEVDVLSMTKEENNFNDETWTDGSDEVLVQNFPFRWVHI